MKNLFKIILIAVLVGGSVYMWNNDMNLGSNTEVLDGYNEEEAEASFEAVKDKFPTKPQASGVTGVNPPHGQPGHRCDIPVGSSLDAPVKTPANNTLINASQSSTAMMNPAHGQPGHRCDIAVGAPLPQ